MRLPAKTLLAALAIALVAGCGPTWKDDEEELGYLKSLANPTPAQYQRRTALDVDPRTGRNRDDQKKVDEAMYRLKHPLLFQPDEERQRQ